MRSLETFSLDLTLGDDVMPPKTQIAVQKHAGSLDGRIVLTPECVSLDEIEGQINMLEDELEQIRQRARRIYEAKP